MVFSTFYMGQLEKTRWHHRKEHLNISKIIAKFESDNIFSERRYSSENLQMFVWWGVSLCPPSLIKNQ